MRFLSPLLDRDLPDLPEVRSRCDEPAGEVIDAAARLAHWRTERTEAEDPRLTRRDVLRAIFAVTPGDLRLDDLRDFDLGAEPDRWSRRLDEATGQVTALDLAIAQRLALADGALNCAELITALGAGFTLALTPFDLQYADGLLTRGESAMRILDGRYISGETSIAPIYRDTGLIDELDSALRRHPGAILAGPPGSGRHALLDAWLRATELDVDVDAALYALGIRRLNQDYYQTRGGDLLFGLRRNGGGARLERFGQWNTHDLEVVAGDHLKLGDRGRLVALAGPDGAGELRDAHPLYAELPIIELSPAAPDAALWWCQLPMVTDRIELTATLPEVLEAFDRTPAEQRAPAHWTTVARALRRLVADQLDVALARSDSPTGRWRRAIRDARRAGEPAGLIALADAAGRLYRGDCGATSKV